ncbi:hypothetical protein Bca52824_090166 [Brassica carinata]|uniref:Uncharacterized protein n=1 Tax=Brassica carinata TaxID=52824 RepID=A0A8X7NU68_BRACI|nr:hypothetical protein Bca52824_090166 [Brassica carinata]
MTDVLHPVYVTISQAILRPGDATGCCSVAAKMVHGYAYPVYECYKIIVLHDCCNLSCFVFGGSTVISDLGLAKWLLLKIYEQINHMN